ncbi:DUF4440 domain-containing protein [Neolewinella persica]|uniref:DUF4440 domain-containing protein n=1 Tax=Neolewinella persica TaxID=70998 RepID=UPI00037A0EBB|nr:DUF4440 domain-containing protein [Neolewinella persica]
MLKYFTFFLLLTTASISAQQYPDTLYTPFIAQAAYPHGEGPRVTFDKGHNNFGADVNGYAALEKLLERDGYRVSTSTHNFGTLKSLEGTDVLVIINALNQENVGTWARPIYSAFTDKEISTLEQWVKRGGMLLMVGDHMPFGGAVKALGAAFGCEWVDGFGRIQPYFWPPSHFEGPEMVNAQSPVISGLQEGEQVSRVATFTGSAFKAPPEAIVALAFRPENTSVQPDTAWRFKEHSPVISLEGHAQGATLDYGKGRVAFWGEAGMLAAQIFRQDWKAGFNSVYAPENAQMVRNLFHWLSGAKLPFTTPVKQPKAPAKTALATEIEARLQAMQRAYEGGDLLTVSYFYDEDAVVTGDGFQIKGREAIDKYWFSFQGLTESWQLDSDLVYGTGDLAYQLGKSSISYRNPGSDKVVTDVTRFTLVWRKNFAGNWKIVSDQYAKE